jgi:beta-N-acetylhexosaminidase
VVPVVKHFPGEGSASADTDVAPAATPPLSTLQQADLLPFEAAIRSGLPAVMVGNASVPGLSTAPASLSPSVITGLLRRQLGFQGLVLTDALSATAISATGLTVPEASVKALEAGADMVVFDSATPDTDARAVVAAVEAAVTSGALPPGQLDQSVGRVLDAKRVDLCHPPPTAPPGDRRQSGHRPRKVTSTSVTT